MARMRGFDVSTDDVSNNFQRALSVGWFPFTIPAAYNGGGIEFQTNGGIFSAGAFPAAASCFLGFTLATADDQPPHSLPLSDSSLTWRPGRHFKLWIAGAPNWSGQGFGATLSATIADGNSRDYTLSDGGAGNPSLPGEGTYLNSGIGFIEPYGYFPDLDGTINEHPPGTYTLTPGAAVEVQFFTQTLPSDNASPLLTCYPLISDITAVVPTASGSLSVPIPLTTFTVGFGIGAQTVPWPPFPLPNVYNYGTPWNAHRAISTTIPATQGNPAGGGAGYQDLFLAGGGTSQGLIF